MAKSNSEKVELPREMLIEILLRLPAKSIAQFRCVSIRWFNLLSAPKFIKAHLTFHSNKEQEKLIFVSECNFLHSMTFNQNEIDDIIPRKICFDRLPDNWIAIDGACNGLVLVEDNKKVQFLINPTTLKYYDIPKFDLALPVPGSFYTYGLGYDVVSDDYKVVALSHYDMDNEYEPDVDYTFVDVHSVRKGVWRRLEPSPYDHSLPGLAPGALLNGALHWLASKRSDSSCVIAAFDLSDEKFLEVPAPAALCKGDFMFNKLVVLRGCLSVINTLEEKFDIWMMKDYWVEKSWTKFEVKGLSFDNYVIPVYLTTRDDVVLDTDGELIAYNMREDEWFDMMEIPSLFQEAGTATFRESLVSPIFYD